MSLPAQGKAARSKADEGVVEAVTSELDAIRLGRGAEIVTVTKDVSGMSETEKLGVPLSYCVIVVLLCYISILCKAGCVKWDS